MYRQMLSCVLVLLCSLAGWARAGDITSDLEAYYKFNEGQGQWAYDSSGMGKDAVLGHDEYPGPDDPHWFVPDWGGFALYFDGNSFLRTAPLFDIGTGAFSVMWFVRQTDPVGYQYILSNKVDFADNFLRLGFNQDDGRLRIYTEQENNEHIMVVTDESFTGEWLWCCVTRSGDVGTLYLNGEFKQNFDTEPGDLGHGESNWWIGCPGAETSTQKFRGYLDEIRVYSRALTAEDMAALWDDFENIYNYASVIYPTNGQEDIPRDGVQLRWTSGKSAQTHDVYVGTVSYDVNEASTTHPLSASVIEGLDVNSLSLDRLDFDTTYYWRVDEVNDTDPDSPWKGDVWSFTIEPEAIPVVGTSVTASGADSGKDADRTIDGSGLNVNGEHNADALNMWQATITDTMPQPQIQYAFNAPCKLYQLHVWNHNGQYEKLLGYGIKEALIEYSLAGLTWTEFMTVELAQATGKADYTGEYIPLNEIVAQFVRITANSNWSPNKLMTYGLSEVRFEAVPTVARELSPADGTVVRSRDVTLKWRNGREAAEHKVYLDVEANLDLVRASAPASLATTFAARGSHDSYTASGLDLAQTYVWKVTEVNEAQTPSAYASSIHSFTTPNYMVLDDMESYDLEHLPWMTWADGYEIAGNGSLVGANPANNDYSPETEIVYNGKQALPIWIDNTIAPQSEATRSFTPSENWTLLGITALSLFVRANTTGGSLYAKINNSKVPLADGSTYPPGYNPDWVQYALDLTAMNVSSVTSLVVGVEGAGATGVIYVDDIRLYAGSPGVTTWTLVGSVIEAESGALTGAFEIREDPNASGGQYIIVPNGSYPNSNDKPVSPGNGWAVYTLDIPADGDYIIAFLGLNEVAGNNDDSFWVNIPDAIHKDAVQAPQALGWLLNDNLFDGPQDSIVWDLVHDDYEDVTDPVVFTLTAGTHGLQISHREDGTGLDAIAILAVNKN